MRKRVTLFHDHWGDLKVEWTILVFILALVVMGVGVAGLLMFITKSSCDQYALLNPEMDYAWRAFGGCLVRYDGVYVPYDKFIGILSR